MAIAPNGIMAYVTGEGADVTPVDLRGPNPEKLIPVKGWGIAITPDGKTAYVTAAAGVVPIDLTTRSPGAPLGPPGAEGIAITPDGRTAYVADGVRNVVAITTATNTVVATIPVGNNPYGIAITPDGTTAYVTNLGDTTVTPINTATNSTGQPIVVGAGPEDIAITPRGDFAFVANEGGGTVTGIDIRPLSQYFRATYSTSIGGNPTGIAITPDGSVAYVSDLGVSGSASVTAMGIQDGRGVGLTSILLAGPGPGHGRGIAISRYGTFLTPQASPTVAVGGAITDSASLSNGPGTNGLGPTGSIAFQLYGTADCAGPPVFTSTKAVAGAGTNVSDPYQTTVAGIYHWVTSYSGDAIDNAVDPAGCTDLNQTVTVTAAKKATLVYSGTQAAGVNDPATVAATLTDGSSGGPIAGATISFALNATETCTGTTDSTGSAACSITPEEPAGAYAIQASYGGSAGTYLPASTSAALTVSPEETSLSSTGTGQIVALGGAASLSSTLSDPDGSAPIAGKPVTMTLGAGRDAQSCTAVTDATGIATCSISPVTATPGPQPVSEAFAGDTAYRAASHSGSVLIFAFGHAGSFVIGDASQSGTVTFWGPQWAKANTLTGGRAPASFKGYEGTGTVTQCGTLWTAQPGEDKPPSGPLPSYMAVAVASHVTKSGAEISGDTVHIVIVKTDGGHDPEDGQAATGQVVGTFC